MADDSAKVAGGASKDAMKPAGPVPKPAMPEGNPVFRMMGMSRLCDPKVKADPTQVFLDSVLDYHPVTG